MLSVLTESNAFGEGDSLCYMRMLVVVTTKQIGTMDDHC